jgi:double-GTPase-like protein
MPYILGAIAVAFVLYILVWALVAATLWVLLPILLIVMPAAALVGVGLGFVASILALAGRIRPPGTVTPDQVRSGSGNVLPQLRGNPAFGRDRAWPSYFSAQAKNDLAGMWSATAGVLGHGWTWISRVLTSGSMASRVATFVGCAPLWVLVSAGALLSTGTLVTAGTAITLALWLCWTVPTGLLRLADQLIRRARGADASCPACYHVTALPAFACPGCGDLHRDIRPGRLGGVWRRCGCGTLLATTVLRAARQIPPRCPRCELELGRGSAVVTDIRVPVFGPISAGKTRLMYTGLSTLRDGILAHGGTTEFMDEDGKREFDHAIALIRSGGDTMKTPASELPRAMTVRLAVGRRQALLHLFDAAGEFYGDREDNSDLEFLDYAQGLVFVVDPFSVPWMRDQIDGASASRVLSRANPATEEPERVYQITAQRLRDYGVPTHKQALAMAVVKADLVQALPIGGSLVRGEVRDWMIEAGLDNLVLSAERDFGVVRYFVVASVPGMGPDNPASPAAPLRWLIGRAGIAPWPDQATGPVERDKETEGV